MHIGGEDFNNCIMKFILSGLDTQHGEQQITEHIRKNPRALQKLRNVCETSKRALSNQVED